MKIWKYESKELWSLQLNVKFSWAMNTVVIVTLMQIKTTHLNHTHQQRSSLHFYAASQATLLVPHTLLQLGPHCLSHFLCYSSIALIAHPPLTTLLDTCCSPGYTSKNTLQNWSKFTQFAPYLLLLYPKKY